MSTNPRFDNRPAFDVVIVGGGAAGLAAALQLARSRRTVVVVDAGEPRNAPAAHMHAYLGHDGRPPAEFLAIGREEILRYGAEIVDGTVTTMARASERPTFDVTLADGEVVGARRVLVASGLVDELPDIPGVAEQWGRGVVHCPYCHGWEVRDRAIAVIGSGPLSTHQAMLFRQLSDHVTLVVHDEAGPDPDDRGRLLARGVRIEDGPVAEVVIEDDDVRGLRLADGRVVDADVVVVRPRFVARSGPLEALGLRPVPAPMGAGEMIETDDRGATSVAGVYAAGNVADVSNQVLQAAAEGSRIGAVINADLVQEDATFAIDERRGGSVDYWDHRYESGKTRWSGRANGALVAEVAGMAPGTALDVGCGEGADAIWLAERGWQVTALDISQVALDRAARTAADAGVAIDLVQADLTSDAPPHDQFDLVSVLYPALRHTPGDDAIRAIIGAVAPGGTLLVVGHALDGAEHHHRRFDPSDYIAPDDVSRHLGRDWSIEVQEIRPRVVPPGYEGPDVPDTIVRARRGT